MDVGQRNVGEFRRIGKWHGIESQFVEFVDEKVLSCSLREIDVSQINVPSIVEVILPDNMEWGEPRFRTMEPTSGKNKKFEECMVFWKSNSESIS